MGDFSRRPNVLSRTEFATYRRLQDTLGMTAYFCQPSALRQKGSVENVRAGQLGETLERVRRDRTLVRKALNESMRYEPVAAFHARQASRDVELRGVTIPQGAAVSLCAAAANRDEASYTDPEVFDIDRPLRPVIGFGYGVHMCLGMQVAQMEIEAAVNAMPDLPNLRLDPDKPHPQIRGMQLRCPDAIHVLWDA